MKNSKAIERAIADLQKSRETVAGSHAGAYSDLQNARKLVVKGTGSAELVSAAQSTFTGLDGALNDADEMLADLRSQLAEAQAREQREDSDTRIKELAAERGSLQSEFNGLQRHVSDIIAREADKLLDLKIRYSVAGRELAELTGNPLPPSILAIREEQTEFGEEVALAVSKLANRRERAQRKRAQAA
jgi:archaellum component FlaC